MLAVVGYESIDRLINGIIGSSLGFFIRILIDSIWFFGIHYVGLAGHLRKSCVLRDVSFHVIVS